MPTLQSFSTWLDRAQPKQVATFLTRRRDLLRADAPSLATIAGAAGARAAVLRAIESLPAGTLQLLHAFAQRARVNPVIELDDLPTALKPGDAPQATAPASDHETDGASDRSTGLGAETDAPAHHRLQELLDLGLVWPARAADSTDPLRATAWRVQAEAIGLLPTAAAQLAHPPRWLTATAPPAPEPHQLSPALVQNAQAGAASQVVSDLVSIVRTVQAAPASQLVKGGIGKRDVNSYASRVKTPVARTVLLLELAGRLGLLGVGGVDSDPVWLPTTEFAPFVDAPRAQAYGAAVQSWLQLPVEIGQLVAGRDAGGGTVHVLGDLAGTATPYPGHASSRPVMPLARYLLLTGLDRLGATGGTAVSAEQFAEAMVWCHPLLPAAESHVVGQLLQEAEYLGLVCTPLGAPATFGLTEVGAQLAAHLRDAMPADTGPLPFAERALTVPEALTDAIADMLPPLLHSVIVQTDLTAVATGPLDPRVATKLESVADVENRGQGTVYRFTDSSVRRALESGLSSTEVLELVEEISGQPPVQPLRFLVNDAADRMHRVRIAAARSVIVVDDPADLDGIAADPIMVTAGLETLTPTVATARVTQERLAQLLDAAGIQAVGGIATRRQPSAAPVRRPAPVTHRSLRVSDADLEAFIADVLHRRESHAVPGKGAKRGGSAAPCRQGPRAATGVPETNSSEEADGVDGTPQSVAATLHEAAAAGNTVVLETVSSTGTIRTLRVRPTAVGAGRMRGLRAGRSDGSEVSLPIARIRAVRPDPASHSASGVSGPTDADS